MPYAGAALLIGGVILCRWTGRPFLWAAVYAGVRLVGPWFGFVEPSGYLPWGADHYLLVLLYFWLLERMEGFGLFWWVVALTGGVYLGGLTWQAVGLFRSLQRQRLPLK